jgi:hypothetical protein
MTREIFYVDDINVAVACIEFAKTLGVSVSDNIHNLEEGMYLTTGSKKFDVNWIKTAKFAKDKQPGIISNLLEDNGVSDFINNLIEDYTPESDEVDLDDEEEIPTPSVETIVALYNKVKSQKKSPKNYFIALRDDRWIATTSDDNSYGNLALVYTAAQ